MQYLLENVPSRNDRIQRVLSEHHENNPDNGVIFYCASRPVPKRERAALYSLFMIICPKHDNSDVKTPVLELKSHPFLILLRIYHPTS